ncbi:4-hydroxy-tetrahydrodipicolinate synthase [candidate division KSB1 bacterium]|nr:MAG: 4-hydroxy-tetrahydrodipicolinate synthase [candidate division KSB1 bacterium]
MANEKFRGTFTALVTPMNDDLTIDEKTLGNLVDFQLQEGIDGLVPCGTTGESPTISPEEQKRIISIVVERVNGKIPVIAGAGTNNTKEAVKLAKAAQAAGATGILSVAPYYNKPTQEGFYRHFRTIAEAVDIPVIIYNIPGRTGKNIIPETIFRLATDCKNIAGVKEASGNLEQISEVIRGRPEGFSVLSGDDFLTLPLIALGGDGVISVISNEIPKLFKEMVTLALNGDFEKARNLHHYLTPLLKVNFIETNPIPVKTALYLMGKVKPYFRLPLCEMSSVNQDKLKKVLQDLKLL